WIDRTLTEMRIGCYFGDLEGGWTVLLWELIERKDAERERQNKGEEREREREIPTGHGESISTHIHGTNSRFILHYWMDCAYKAIGFHAIRSQTMSWTVPRL